MLLVVVENAVGRLREPLARRQQLADDLLRPRRRPHGVEEPSEQPTSRRADEHLAHPIEALAGVIEVGLLGGKVRMGHRASSR